MAFYDGGRTAGNSVCSEAGVCPCCDSLSPLEGGLHIPSSRSCPGSPQGWL